MACASRSNRCRRIRRCRIHPLLAGRDDLDSRRTGQHPMLRPPHSPYRPLPQTFHKTVASDSRAAATSFPRRSATGRPHVGKGDEQKRPSMARSTYAEHQRPHLPVSLRMRETQAADIAAARRAAASIERQQHGRIRGNRITTGRKPGQDWQGSLVEVVLSQKVTAMTKQMAIS